jgi:hypothetical protein
MKQYLQDNDGVYPAYFNYGADGAVSPDDVGWADVLEPYLKSVQIFQCPSNPSHPLATKPYTDSYGYTEYFYNSNPGCPPFGNPNNVVKESLIDYSSNVILFGDGGRGSSAAMANYPDDTSATCPDAVVRPGDVGHDDLRQPARAGLSVHLALAGDRDALTPVAGLERIDAELKKAYTEAAAPEAWKLIRYDTGHGETPEMRRDALQFLEQWL